MKVILLERVEGWGALGDVVQVKDGFARNYLLPRSKALDIFVEGFRTSAASVAAFRLGSVGESYSQQRHGTARNVGVIGIAVFEEYSKDLDRRVGANPFPRRWATGP